MIKVSIYGVARLNAGTAHFESNAQTLKELRREIPNLNDNEANGLIALVNGKSASNRYRLKDGDEVVFMSPVGGG